MKFILSSAKLSFLALLICFTFISCDEEDDFQFEDDVIVTPQPPIGETGTIIDFVNENDDYSSLAAALDAAGLTETLDGDTDYTVFAPDNDAFQALLDSNEDWTELGDIPTDLLTQVLMNHVQAGTVLSTDLSTGYIASLAEVEVDGNTVNPSLYINTDGGVTLNGVSEVVSADNQVDNGVIHAVDAVIGLPDVTTFAVADPTFSILEEALIREDLVGALQADGPFTVFAPTDDAFAALLEELELGGLDDIDSDLLTSVLTYHVIPDANVTSGDLSDGMTVTTMQGEDITINIAEDGAVTLTDARGRTSTVILEAVDIQGTNGIVHAIDTVILPSDDDNGNGGGESNSIADFVENNDDYSSLFAALEAAGLTSILDGEDNYTVFAPDNDAFDTFLSENGFASLDEVPADLLENILMYHVQVGVIMSGDLETGYFDSMVDSGYDNSKLSVFVNTGANVRINGVSTVVDADIEVDNGVIHAIDAVLGLPDVTTFALADPRFDLLVEAMTREDSYEFVDILQSQDNPPAPFTVFAPTDNAFENLLTELGVAGLGEIDADLLADVLSYHVVTGSNVRSDMITDGMEVDTFLENATFTINIDENDDVIITDGRGRNSEIIAVDVQTTNGVLHAIDTVILPAE